MSNSRSRGPANPFRVAADTLNGVRLAWFSPWPPQTSGVAGRSVEVTSELASRGFAIDVFVEKERVPAAAPASNDAPRAGDIRVQSAHDFVWRHHRGQYDLVVYQLGNSTAHGFTWPYLLRYPGVTILHDAHLHHSRGAALLNPQSAAPYRAAFALDHPDVSPDVAELAVAGLDGSYYFLWPMVRSAVLASRAVGVHTRGGAAALQAQWPDALIDYVALGSGRSVQVDEATRQTTRAALGISRNALLFGTFGGLTADKRVPQILRAFAPLVRLHPHAHLLLAGAADARLDLQYSIETLGLARHVTLAPNLDDDAFERAVATVDVSLNLRWPTARETSGPWLQALAAARPTVIIDLAHQSHLPVLDPQTWRPRPSATAHEPICVALDILDEEHSLGLAMARLARDGALRASLGAAARRYWEREHTVTRMADDYARLIMLAIERPANASQLPASALPDPCQPARELAGPPGDLSCELF